MDTSLLRVLMVEDSKDDSALILRQLHHAGYLCMSRRVQDEASMRDALTMDRWDVVLCDSSIPRFGARCAIDLLEQMHLDIPLILVSGTARETTIADAMAAGAFDFVSKADLPRLLAVVERALRQTSERRAPSPAAAEHGDGPHTGGTATQPSLKSDDVAGDQSAAIALDETAGGVVHDFNNALSVILMYASLLAGNLPHDDPTREDLGEIVKAATRASALARRLLSAGLRPASTMQSVDLDGLIAGLERTLRRILGDAITLTVIRSPDLRPVRVDPAQMESAVLNLVLNARDAMPSGGTVTIETANVVRAHERRDDGSQPPAGRCVMLSVTDTGTGMDETVKARAFDRLFTTKGPDKGTGLGLSTTRDFVRECGGAIDVDSAPGKGTRFEIHVPAEPARGESVSESDPECAAGSKSSAVEVDDTCQQVCREVAGASASLEFLSQLTSGESYRAVRDTTIAIHRIELAVTDLRTRLGSPR